VVNKSDHQFKSPLQSHSYTWQYNTSGRYFPSTSLQQIINQPDQAAVFQLIHVPMMRTIWSSFWQCHIIAVPTLGRNHVQLQNGNEALLLKHNLVVEVIAVQVHIHRKLTTSQIKLWTTKLLASKTVHSKVYRIKSSHSLSLLSSSKDNYKYIII
jgi:hypothetical protein